MFYDQIFFCVFVSIFFTVNFYKVIKGFFKTFSKQAAQYKPVPTKATDASPTSSEQQAKLAKKDARNKLVTFGKLVANVYCGFNNVFVFIGMIGETYLIGAKMYMNCLAIGLGYVYGALFIQPFMYDLDKSIKSPYEYLAKRHRDCVWIRVVTAFVGTWFFFGFMAIYLSSCAIFLTTLFPTTFKFWQAAVLIGLYSMAGAVLGGYTQSMKINVAQFILFMIGTTAAIIISFQYNENGSSRDLWKHAYTYGRTTFYDITSDLTTKYTILSQVFSLPIPWVVVHCLVLPSFVRYRSISPRIKSRVFLLSNLPVMLIVNLVLAFGGIASFVYFYGCDPRATKDVLNKNQLPVYWLIQTLKDKLPALAGICTAAILCYGVFQHSAGMITITNMIISEILEPLNLTRFYKSSVLRTNFFKFGLTFLVSSASIVYSVGFLFTKVTIIILFFIHSNALNSPILGAIVLSMLNPYSNRFGILFSFIINVGLNVWISLGTLVFSRRPNPEFPVDSFNCEGNFTMMKKANVTYYPTNPGIMYIYSITPIWYGIWSMLFMIIIGSLASFLFSLVTTRSLDCDRDFKEERKKYMFSFRKHLFKI